MLAEARNAEERRETPTPWASVGAQGTCSARGDAPESHTLVLCPSALEGSSGAGSQATKNLSNAPPPPHSPRPHKAPSCRSRGRSPAGGAVGQATHSASGASAQRAARTRSSARGTRGPSATLSPAAGAAGSGHRSPCRRERGRGVRAAGTVPGLRATNLPQTSPCAESPWLVRLRLLPPPLPQTHIHTLLMNAETSCRHTRPSVASSPHADLGTQPACEPRTPPPHPPRGRGRGRFRTHTSQPLPSPRPTHCLLAQVRLCPAQGRPGGSPRFPRLHAQPSGSDGQPQARSPRAPGTRAPAPRPTLYLAILC